MTKKLLHHLSFLCALLLPGLAQAGSFTQNFEALADNAPLATGVNTHVNLVGATDAQGRVISSRKETNNAGTYIVSVVKPNIGTTPAPSKAMRLAEKGTISSAAAYLLPTLDAAAELQDITFSLDLLMDRTAGAVPADGFNISFGRNLSNVGGAAGHQTAFGFVVNFDTYSNGTTDPRSIEIFSDGVSVGNFLATGLPAGNFPFDQTWRRVELHWDANGLDLTYASQVIFENLPLPGFQPLPGSAFALNSVTGGLSQDTFIDNLSITTVAKAPPANIVTSDVILSEIMADNAAGLEDEDLDQPDWVELYNGTSTTVTLTGWQIEAQAVVVPPATVAAPPVIYTVPTLTIPAFGYQVILASGKNRFTNVYPHANFTLEKSGGTLRLLRPGGNVVSSLSYGPQKEDVSYGRLDAALSEGHLALATPGARNMGPQAMLPPLDVPVFDQLSRVVTTNTPINLALSPPLGAPVGAEIRYTLNNTEVFASSPVYTAPLVITTGTTVRASVFAPGHLQSKTATRSFLWLASGTAANNLADNYNAGGQPFTSNLPLLVMDSYRKNVDALTDPLSIRPYRYTHVAVYDVNPATGRASLNAMPDLVTRGGTHVRGQSSSGQPERPYALEFWKEHADEDEDHPLLGFPSHSDWVLMTLTLDKSLMRNYLMQQLMLDANGAGAGMRCRFVEVIFNQNDSVVDYSDYRGVYLLMEKVSRGRERVNIAKINGAMSDPSLIYGGYIIKNDKTPYDASFTPTGNAQVPGSGRVYDIYDPEPPTAAQVTAIRNYFTALGNALGASDFKLPASANYWGKWIEERTMIDKTLWLEACKEVDAYTFSYYFSKDRNDQRLRGAPFWDVDRSLGNSNYGGSNSAYGWKWWYAGTNYTYYNRLAQDAEFNDRYWNRWYALRRGLFAREKLEARIEAAYSLLNDGSATPVVNNPPATLQNPVARHYRKYTGLLGNQSFGGGQTGQASRVNYRQEVDALKSWLWDRLDWIDAQTPHGVVRVLDAATNAVTSGGNVPVGYTYRLQNTAAMGDVYYTLNGADPRQSGGTLASTASQLTDDGGQTTSVILAEKQMWKWLLPTSAPDAAWFTEAFNDSTWSSGLAPLGYGEPVISVDLSTNISQTPPNYTSATTEPGVAYFRSQFTLASLPTVTGARFEIQADDGAVIYLNGQEVARINFPYAPATAAFTQEANGPLDPAGSKADAERIYYPIAFDASKLKVGVNTLAVQVHQAVYSFPSNPTFPGNALSDLRFDLRIVGVQQGQTGTALTLNSAGSQTVRARAYNAATASWGPLSETTFVVSAEPASASNIVVSELHYHPTDPTAAELALGFNRENDFEYVELMNIGSTAVDLSGVVLEGAVDFSFATAVPESRFLPPGARVVVVENTAAFQSRMLPGNSALVAGSFLGNFANSTELLTIRAANGSVIKSFSYSDDMPWPTDADGRGYSLVLNAPVTNPDHNLPTSWLPSLSINGTPGSVEHAPTLPAAAWTGDADHDGFSDALEAAMALGQPAGRLPLVLEDVYQGPTDPEPAIYLFISCVRDLNTGAIQFVPKMSNDLQTWDPNKFVLHSAQHNGDGTATLLYRSTVPASSLPRAFYQVQVVPSLP